MSSIHEEVKTLLTDAGTTWDFINVRAALRAVAERIQQDGTLLDLERKRLNAGVATASSAIELRRYSPLHLQEALLSVKDADGKLSDEQASQLASWFFAVAYSGKPVTPEIEELVKPILARTQGNPSSNKSKLATAFERYRRLSDWGTDLILSENNLRGLLVAIRVLPLPAGFASEERTKCEQVLNNLQMRKALSPSELVKDCLGKCQKLIDPVWSTWNRGEKRYLEENDTYALNICLTKLLEKVSETEELADDAKEITDQINLLRSHFQDVRYRSSTTILVHIKQEIQSLEQTLATTIDFHALKQNVKELHQRIQQAKRGKRGINWMGEHHIAEAQAAANDLWQTISKKEQSTTDFNNELLLFEEAVTKLENQLLPLTANQLKRLNARVKNDSPLVKWIAACFQSQTDRNEAWGRIEGIRSRLRELWTRMESQEEQRATEFRDQCVDAESRIQQSVELRQTLSEILELRRCLDDLTREKQEQLQPLITGLFKTFNGRVADVAALRELLQGIFDDVDRAHRRIFSAIDFDRLNERAVNAKQWLFLREFPQEERDRMADDVRRCFAEIRKLQFRQQKMIRERQARANELTEELQQEITETVARASANPGNRDTWLELIDLDRRLSSTALSSTPGTS